MPSKTVVVVKNENEEEQQKMIVVKDGKPANHVSTCGCGK